MTGKWQKESASHPAVVSEELWDKAQAALAERSVEFQKKKPERKRNGDSHNTYSLSGKLFCPKCGALLHQGDAG
ncbi:hypothetical protein D5282_11170 [bacterium 1xD8-48]|jgi:hypothetical protein|nr:hypothetical protein [Lachnospiraceae bacterium]NBJ97879.1 hypothetical protein [bacterium 1xD8-48]